MSADWYCPKCERFVGPASVTFEETHDACGCPVVGESPYAKVAALEAERDNLLAKELDWITEVREWREALTAEANKCVAAQAEVARLRVCGNCHNQYWDGSTFECDFCPCGDDVADEPNDDVYPSAPCCLTPSRWTAREEGGDES